MKYREKQLLFEHPWTVQRVKFAVVFNNLQRRPNRWFVQFGES